MNQNIKVHVDAHFYISRYSPIRKRNIMYLVINYFMYRNVLITAFKKRAGTRQDNIHKET